MIQALYQALPIKVSLAKCIRVAICQERQLQAFCKRAHICARSLLHSILDHCCTACQIPAAQHAASLLHSMLHHCCTACRITAAQHASSLLHSMLASKVPVNPACCCCMHFNVLTCFACIRKRPSAHNSERSCNVTDVRTVVCHSFAVFNRVRFEE